MSGVTDPISDLLTRIRNAAAANHDQLVVPASKLKMEVAKILRDEGYIGKCELVDEGWQGQIRIALRYGPKREPVITGVQRVSKPGLRVYVGHDEIPRVRGGMGLCILSTPQGVMSDKEARRRHLGGEVLCRVW